MWAWVEQRCHWGQLREIGSSNIVKASVLMPVFGYMLLLNDNVQQYLTVRYDGWLLKYLPSLWRVWLLFYGSFFVAIATILYAWRCPSEVKKYPDAFRMAEGETQYQLNLSQYEMMVDYVRALSENFRGWHRELMADVRIPNLQPGWQSLTDMQRMSNLQVYQWTAANHRNPWLRISIYLLYRFGFILLAVPAGFTFIQVSLIAMKRVF